MSDDADAALDLTGAAALIAEARAHADRELRVRLTPVYLAWGLAWLVGLGGLWLSVRGQHPFIGPSGPAYALLAVLEIVATTVTAVTVVNATRGVRGMSETQGVIYGLAWPFGLVLAFAVVGALERHGASNEVSGIAATAAGPMVVAIVYVVGSAIWLNRSMLALGLWLGLITAIGASFGPVTLLAVEALAGGSAFLVAAALPTTR